MPSPRKSLPLFWWKSHFLFAVFRQKLCFLPAIFYEICVFFLQSFDKIPIFYSNPTKLFTHLDEIHTFFLRSFNKICVFFPTQSPDEICAFYWESFLFLYLFMKYHILIKMPHNRFISTDHNVMDFFLHSCKITYI